MEKYRVFDDFLDAVIITDSQKKVIYCNHATELLTGLSVRKIKQAQQCYDLFKFDDNDVYIGNKEEINSNNEGKFIESSFHLDGGNDGVGLTQSRKYEENLVLTIIRDMSLEVTLHQKYHHKIEELNETNAKLEVLNKNLEKLVEERTKELQIAHEFLDTMVNSLDQGLLVFNLSLIHISEPTRPY